MKKYTIKVSSERNGRYRETEYNGTLEELIDTFSYTLCVGASYKRSIITSPKTIKSLLSNLEKAERIRHANSYNYTSYELVK